MTSKGLEVEGRSERDQDDEKTGGQVQWGLKSKVPVKVLRAHTDAVTAARFCFGGRCVLSCSSDNSAILWDVGSCRPLRVFHGIHENTITECALIPNSNRIVTVSWDKKMVAWDLETGQIQWQSGQAGLLTSCSVSSDSRFVICAVDPQNSVYISDAASGQMLHHINNHHRSTIMRCRFDPQSQRVATVSADRSIKLWDLRAKKTTLSIDSKHRNVVSSCCYTSNGHFLCTASWDKTLKLWDLHTGGFRSHGEITLQRGHEGSVSSCSFSADANLLVSGSYDRTVALWDMSSLCQALILKGHSDWVTDVSISSDVKWVTSASKDKTVRLWDIRNTVKMPEVRQAPN